MKKTFLYLFTLILAILMLSGCEMAASESEAKNSSDPVPTVISEASAASEPASQASESSREIDTSVSERDASGTYDGSEAYVLSPGEDLTIREGGIYILSGIYTNQMIVVDAGEEAKVQIVLQNADISNENGPAIYVRSADKVFLTAEEGTENTISDGSDYSVTEDDTTIDAAVFSKDDLTINGEGSLTISGNYKHGVVSKDDLVVTAKNLTVSAQNVALNGKDCVILSGASVVLTAGSDAIRSDNDTDEDKGYVSSVSSKIEITAGKDGIQAETVFYAEDTVITIVSGGGSSARAADSEESYKGIKAENAIEINGGTYRIDSLDDALHTNGSITISAGDFTIQSGDDAVHADEKIEISGGTINVTAAEGVEATYILISGGDISVWASDDGLNAAAKSDSYTPTFEMTGGTLTVEMGQGDTDGIDSNGNIIISGGTIYVNGNSTFDYDGTVSFTGGTVYVNGEEVTSIPNQFGGGFGGGFGGFGGQGGSGGKSGFSRP